MELILWIYCKDLRLRKLRPQFLECSFVCAVCVKLTHTLNTVKSFSLKLLSSIFAYSIPCIQYSVLIETLNLRECTECSTRRSHTLPDVSLFESKRTRLPCAVLDREASRNRFLKSTRRSHCKTSRF